MPYFDLRLKLQTFLIIFVITIFVLISVLSSSSNNPKEISELDIPKVSFLQILPWTYENSSSASFLAIYSLVNLYVCMCAYFYSPSFSTFTGKNSRLFFAVISLNFYLNFLNPHRFSHHA